MPPRDTLEFACDECLLKLAKAEVALFEDDAEGAFCSAEVYEAGFDEFIKVEEFDCNLCGFDDGLRRSEGVPGLECGVTSPEFVIKTGIKKFKKKKRCIR